MNTFPSTASGSFVYDADANTYSSINISTTASTVGSVTFPASVYTALSAGAGTPSTSNYILLFAPAASATLFIVFSQPLANAGGNVAITNYSIPFLIPGTNPPQSVQSLESADLPPAVFRGIFAGSVVGGSLSSVPALNTVSLITLTMLLGALALYLHLNRAGAKASRP